MPSVEGMVAFTARTAQRTAILAALGSGAGALVVGETGSGRSRLLAESVGGYDAARLTGTCPDVPFGALAHLLPAGQQPLNPVRWAAEAVEQQVIAVDDAHLLDTWSAAVVGHLVRHRGACLVATARCGATLPAPLAALWKDGLMTRVDLGPLTVTESSRLLAATLGGRVEGMTTRRLWHLSGGNVRFLLELAASGSMVRVRDEWRWPGEIVLPDRLRQLVEASIGEVDEQEREALELIVIGEPLGLDALLSLVPADAVDRLERRGLIGVDHHPLRVRLAHPLYAQVLRTLAGPVRTRQHLARVLPFSGRHEGEELSAREREIAGLAVLNLSNREIADLLIVSPRTVGNHLCRIYAKLGVNDRFNLARLLA